MPAWKALSFVAVLGVLVAFGLFLLFPDTRPPVVKAWFRKAQGFGPAKTPTEALDRFRDAVKKRDYETAATFCGPDYAEQMRKAAKGANKLGTAADELMHNVEEVANINSPMGKYVIRLLEPFPRDFKYDLLDASGRPYAYKEGDTVAYANILLMDGKPLNARDLYSNQNWNFDERILLSLVPIGAVGAVPVKLEGEKEKAWKIHFPVTPRLRESVDYLKENAGNYARALDNLKYAIKHEAATKEDFENQLRTQLEKAK